MIPRTILATSLFLGCTGTVGASATDASVDGPWSNLDLGYMDGEGTVDGTAQVDVLNGADLADAIEARDATDARDVPAPLDAPDGGRCPLTLPDGGAPPPPPGVARSCGPGGAPAWHCNEVAYCGGEFVMGSTDAAQVRGLIGTSNRTTFPMRSCDPRMRTVRGGYVDAYEVTVARFRTWVRAGMPYPGGLEYVFPDGYWRVSPQDVRPPGYVNSGDRDTVAGNPATIQNCSWSPTDGINDDLPINCVDRVHAMAFCWWDGRHMIPEDTWEYLASNFGTTSAIRPGDLTQPAGCGLGDLNARNGICPRRDLPRSVDAFPLSGPPALPGLFGMIGGVMEYTGGFPSPLDGFSCLRGAFDITRCCGQSYPARDDYTPREGVGFRGSSWWLNAEDQRWMSHVSSRFNGDVQSTDGRPTRSPNLGIRCARWVPGVW